jgi:hypothetical protein
LVTRHSAQSSIKTRISRKEYGDFIVILTLNSNNDTGDDRIRIFVYDSVEIYRKSFGYTQTKIKLSICLESHSNLKFIVDNTSNEFKTPGAFQATIKIQELN